MKDRFFFKKKELNFSDAMITVAVNSLTSFASGFVIFMFLVG
jgi:hypothetical protein